MIPPNDPEALAKCQRLCPEVVYAYYLYNDDPQKEPLAVCFRRSPEETLQDLQCDLLRWALAEANKVAEAASQALTTASQAATDAALTVEDLTRRLAAADANAAELIRNRTAPPPPTTE